MKKLCIAASCAAFVMGTWGCVSEECSGVTERGQELAADLGQLNGSTRTFVLEQDDGTLSVEVTFGNDSTSGWDALATRGVGVDVMTYLSDLLIPPAYADCAIPIAGMEVTYTARWSTVEGTSIVLAEQVSDSAEYTGGARSGNAYFPEATALTITGNGGLIELVSTEGDARSLKLLLYVDGATRQEYSTTLECPAGSDDCIVNE